MGEGLTPTVLTVVTEATLGAADELYDFYRANGIRHVAFNVEELEAANTASPILSRDFEPRFRAFLRRFIRRMAEEPGAISLREVDAARSIVAWGGVPDGYAQESEPLRILSITREGDVSSFSPELLGMHDGRYGDFTFGNVLTDPLDRIVARLLDSALCRDIAAGVAACRRECGWFDACRGASPANKLYENGSFVSSETAYCRLTRQIVLDEVLGMMEAGTVPAAAA